MESNRKSAERTDKGSQTRAARHTHTHTHTHTTNTHTRTSGTLSRPTEGEVGAVNGVVHVIDRVLMPEHPDDPKPCISRPKVTIE